MMRQILGWIAALGLTSLASPALAETDEAPVSAAQPEFDTTGFQLEEQRLTGAHFSGSQGIDRTASSFGSSDWDAMIHKLTDAPVPVAQADLVPVTERASFGGGLFQHRLAVAATEESGGEAAEAEAPFDVSATLTGVSDYRFRGLSLSDRDPALQASIDVEHQSGFYAGVWGSTIAQFAGAKTEVDVYGGWRGSFGGLSVDASVTGYFYPNGQDATYVELLGSLGYTLGPVEAKLGVAYAPDQANLGSDDSFYAYGQLKAALPGTPVTLIAQAGHEEGALGGPTGQKWDWSLGAQVVKDRFTLGLNYVDTNVDRVFDPDKVARAGVVLSLSIGF